MIETRRTVLFEIGSEQVVNYHMGVIYVEGPGAQYKVTSLVDNDYMISGKVRYKETKEFLTEYLTKKELDIWAKEEYLNEIIQKHVLERTEKDLNDMIAEYEDWEISDLYYNDESLNEIVGLIYDVFAYESTRAEVDVKMNEFLGYYAPSFLMHVSGYGYYFFFE